MLPKVRPSLRIAIIYLCIGVIWILTTDIVVDLLISDKNIVREIQTYKGWFFVFVSSLLILKLCSDYEKKLEDKISELKNVNEELRFFFYKASHDLRGPVKSILGLTTIMRMNNWSENLPLITSHIDASARKADHLIYDLDRLANVIEGPLQEAPINFNAIIHKVRKRQHERFPDMVNKTKFTIKVSDDNCHSHLFLLELILDKLIENAVIFTAPFREEPQIEISIEHVKESLKIKVRDNGIGIEPKRIPQIFDMFYKGTEASQGSGLGLYIARLAVDRLKGRILVKSIDRKESVFTVLIPL